MAIFNPIAPEEQPQNYTDRSRGIGESRVFRTLFGGIANMIEGAVNAQDELNKERIYEDTVNQSESIQAPFIQALQPEAMTAAERTGVTPGVGTGGRAGGTGQGNVRPIPQAAIRSAPGPEGRWGPPEEAAGAAPMPMVPAAMAAEVTELTRIQNAYDQGTIRDAYYHNKLFSMTKGLRAKYPGYLKEIDAIVQNVTGINPANALVSDFFQEAAANASARDSAANARRSFENSNLTQIGQLYPDYFTNPEKYADPAVYAQVQQDVANVRANEANVDAAKKRLELKSAQGEDVRVEASGLMMNEAARMGNQFVTAYLNTDSDFMKQLQAAQSNPGVIDPAKVQELVTGAQSARTAIMARVDQMLYTPDENGQTMAGYINDNAKIEAIRQAAIAPIDNILKAITDGDWSLANRNATMSTQMLEQDKRLIYEKFPVARAVEAVRSIGGDNAVNSAIAAGSPIGGQWNEFLRQSLNIVAAGGQGTANDMTTKLADDFKSNKVSTEVITGNIDAVVEEIQNPALSPELAANNANYLFSDANMPFLQNFKTERRTDLYAKMVNPQMTERMYEIGKVNPQLWNNYVRYAATNFQQLFRNDAETVNTTFRNRKGLTIQWNPENTQFEITAVNPAAMVSGYSQLGPFIGPLASTVGTGAEVLLSAEAVEATKRINLQLNSIRGIVEKAGGEPNVEILKLLSSMGVDPSAPKEGPFLDSLFNAILGHETYIRGKAGDKYGPSQGAGGEGAAPFPR